MAYFPRSRSAGVFVLLLALCVTVTLRAGEAETPKPKAPTAEELQAWVKQLGDDDFQKRLEAQKALGKAGLAAQSALEGALNSADIEVRNTARSLLDQIKWMTLPADINYVSLFPSDTMMLVHLPKVATSVKDSKSTALAKLIDSEPFKPLRALLESKMKSDMPTDAQAGLTTFKEWATHFEGQVAAGMIKMQMAMPPVIDAFVVAEITDEDPEAVFQKFLNDTQIFLAGAGERFEGLQIRTGLQNQGAAVLAGKHLIIAPSVESVKAAAKGLLKAADGNLRDSESFKKVMSHAGPRTDLLYYMNMDAYMKFVAGLGMGVGANLFQDLGYDQMEAIVIATSIDGDVFEDRIIMTTKTEGEAKGIMRLLAAAQAADPARNVDEALKVAPADAVMVASSYLDGTALMTFMREYLKTISDMQAAMGMPGGGPDGPDLDFVKYMKLAEEKTGVKVADIAASVKGDMVMWVNLKAELAPPDIGVAMPCPDGEKAKTLAGQLVPMFSAAARAGLEHAAQERAATEKLMKELEAAEAAEEDGTAGGGEAPAEGEKTTEAKGEKPAEGEPKPAGEETAEGEEKSQPDAPAVPADAKFFEQVEKGGHTLYVESEESPLMKVPERMMMPYRLCWAAHGNKVLVSSSVPGLLHRLKALDANEAGFDAQKLAGANVKIDGTMTGMSVVDLAKLFNYAAKHGLPLAAMQMGNDPEVQKLMQDLAAKENVFDAMPPLLLVNRKPTDGVTSAVIRGPAPYLPTVFGAAFVAGFLMNSGGPVPVGPGAVAPAPGP